MPGGRPSTYTSEQGEEICRRIAGGESLNRICGDPAMPSRDGVYGWLRRHEEFAVIYARAVDVRTDRQAEEIVDIADEDIGDMVAAQRNKLRVDARKWTAARMKPRKWGDRQQLEHSTPDGVTVEIRDYTGRTPGGVVGSDA